MGRLISVGNVIVDIVMRVEAIPEPGGDIIASGSEITAGGGLNTMVAAKRDGLEVVFAGQYGTGPFGDVVRAALGDSGIEVVQPGLPGIDSGYCVALVDATTERTFVTSVGAEGRLSRDDLDRVTVEPTDTVFVSGYGLAHPINAEAIVGWLRALPAEIRVVFDPSPLVDTLGPDTLDPVLARADVVSTNGREARLLSPGADDLAAAAAGIVRRIEERRGEAKRQADGWAPERRSDAVVLVRDGAEGCWVATTADPAILITGFAVDAVDTNGAGDTHDGVVIAALSRGDDLHSAVRRANAAAALAVTRFGPATAPSAVEIDDLLDGS